jgi:hypothetical protein
MKSKVDEIRENIKNIESYRDKYINDLNESEIAEIDDKLKRLNDQVKSMQVKSMIEKPKLIDIPEKKVKEQEKKNEGVIYLKDAHTDEEIEEYLNLE